MSGYTVTAIGDVSDSLSHGRHYLTKHPRAHFYIVLVGKGIWPNLSVDDLDIGIRLVDFKKIGLTDKQIHDWPIISTSSEMLSSVIPYAMNYLLTLEQEIAYLRTYADGTLGLEAKGTGDDVFLECISDPQKIAILETHTYVQRITARRQHLLTLERWIRAVESCQALGPDLYALSLWDVLAPISFSFVKQTSESVEVRTSVHATGWNEIFPGFPFRDSLRVLLRDEIRDSPRESNLPSPFVVNELHAFIEWGKVATYIGGHEVSLFTEALIKDQGTRELSQMGMTHPPEYFLFPTSLIREQQNSIELIDEGPVSIGVDVFGYMNAGLGVGEAARLTSFALKEVDVSVAEIPIPRSHSQRLTKGIPTFRSHHDVALLSLDAFNLEEACLNIGTSVLESRYLIGQWFWELDEAPEYYKDALSFVDEFWAPTLFIADSMKRLEIPDVLITHMPLPIVAPMCDQSLSRDYFGLNSNFIFHFSFDYLSVMERKNPEGLVRAYMDAFAPNDGALLLLKSINGHLRNDDKDRLLELCKQRRDIVYIDKFLSRSMTSTLMSLSDCYVSLHRSEGFGLTLAEAMSLAKPVIATGYSGNLDFMNATSSLLLPFQFVEVGRRGEGYPSGSRWAEPDHGAAVAAMQKVFEDREFARELGDRGAVHVRKNFSPTIVGGQMRARLNEIRKTASVV